MALVQWPLKGYCYIWYGREGRLWSPLREAYLAVLNVTAPVHMLYVEGEICNGREAGTELDSR